MKKTMLIVTVLAAVIGATAVWSQGRPGPGGPPGMDGPMMSCPAMAVAPPRADMFDRLAGTLKLSKTQTAKLKQVAAKNDKTLSPLRQKAAEYSRALRDAVLASKYDARKTKDLAAKAEKAESNVVAASIGAWTQIRAILTADQVAKLRTAMSHGPGPGPFGPPPGAAGFGPPPPPK
ncbi:MAG: periplasmic heavy metal sensor [Armatimonadetes bacterium]|nr:periplasmic heavy metal sensor [Armatimonadota bacterium]